MQYFSTLIRIISLTAPVILMFSIISLARADELSGNLVQLTKNGGVKTLGSWSPDSKWITYSMVTKKGVGLWKVNVANSKSDLLKDVPSLNSEWSPDGSMIAYVQNDDIWVLEEQANTVKQITQSGKYNGSISWSTDNTGIYAFFGNEKDMRKWYIAQVDLATGKENIIFSHENGRKQLLSIGSKRNGGGIVGQAWGPKGMWLYEMDLSKKEMKQIIKARLFINRKDSDEYLMNPDPSPSGNHIVYQVGTVANDGLWVVKANGKNKTRLLPSGKIRPGASDPIWSPDGSTIAFLRYGRDSSTSKGIKSDIWLYKFSEKSLSYLNEK